MPNLLGIDSTNGIIEDIQNKVKGSDSLLSVQATPLNFTPPKSTLDNLIGNYSKQVNSKIGGYSDVSKYNEFVKLNDGNYINPFEGEDYYVGTDNNERLAQKQSTGEKWANGITKWGVKSGTAIVGGTIGILDSLITGMASGSLAEATNSKLNKTLDDINTYVDYKLPNRYTEQERNAGLFEQITDANFYADKVLGGLSFLTGAIVSEAIWTAATAATFGGTSELLALNTAKQLSNAAKYSVKAFGGTKGFLKTLNAAKTVVKSPATAVFDDLTLGAIDAGAKTAAIRGFSIGKKADIIIPMVRSSFYESNFEGRIYGKQTEETWLENFREKNQREPSSEEYAIFKDKLTSSQNAVVLGNAAILSVSNYFAFGKAAQGVTTARTITNNSFSRKFLGQGYNDIGGGVKEAIKATTGQKIFGRVYGLGSGFARESQEEMGQSVISGTAENYLMAGYDTEKTKSGYDVMSAFGDAVHKTYTTKEGQTEGLIGGIIGVMGNVGGGIKNKFNKDSKGNAKAFFESDNKLKEIEDGVEYSNNLTSAMHLNNVRAANKMQMAQEMEDSAKRSGDLPAQKLAETLSSIALFERNIAVGGLKEGIADFNKQVKSLTSESLMDDMGFTTEDEVNAYKKHLIDEHQKLANSYEKNLEYSETLVGEKDFQGRKDLQEFLKGEGLAIGSGIQEIQRAMAMTLTMGEKARETHFDITGTLNDEIVNLTNIEGLNDANNVAQILALAPQEKIANIKKLKNEKTNLTARLATLQRSLQKEGKQKTGEDASARQNRLIDITTEIQEVQDKRNKNQEEREIALNGLGVSQYTEGTITSDILDKQEENVLKFKTFMEDLQKKSPEKYSKIIKLLEQQNKSIKHIKNYEKSVQAITNKETRLKEVNNWLGKLFLKNKNLKDGQKAHFLNILKSYDTGTKIVVENSRQQIENREAFIANKKESLENVAQSYIDNLLKEDYNGLLKIDQEIVDKYKGEEVASMEAPKEESTEKPIDQLQILKDKVKELTSDVYTTQYIGDALDEANRHKPKDSDVEEYETLLKKWNRKAEKSLARIISRPSDYKYKDLGLNEAEIDRLKELNTTLGNWMSFTATDAGNGESVADLIQRINLLEQSINTQEIKKELSDKDIKLVVEATEAEAKSVGNQYRGLQTGTDVLAIIKQKENTITFSHIKTASLSSIFPNSSMLINPNGTFEINVNGRTLIGKENGKGGQVMNLEDWNSFKKESNVLIKDFGNVYNAVSQFIGVDSQGKELYKTLESDFTYEQLDGTNIKIDSDEVNRTKKGELVDLFISTQDVYNSKLDPKNTNSDLHIYVMKNGNLIGSVPRGYSDEDPSGLGLPLRDLRKNSAEFLKNTGLKGLVKLPYKMEAGIIIVGTPYITLQKDENGDVSTKQNDFTKESLQNVVGTGYSLNGEIVSKVNVDVKQFARKLGEENKDKKVPLIIANIEGKTIAFPVNLKSQIVDMSAPILEANKLKDTDRLNIIIQTLVDNNIDPNSFGINFSSPDWVTQEKELENVLKALQNVVVYKDIDDFASEKYDLRSLKDDVTIAIELDKTPFASSKIMLKISSKLDTDVLGYRENLAKIEEKRFITKTALNEVIKDIHFEFDKNLALGRFDNRFITTLSENPLYEGTSDNILSRNINALKIAIKGMSQTTKKIVGADLIDNARYLIKEIEFYNSEAKKTKTEIDNSEYYADVNQDFITVGEDGELNNPHVLESQVIQQLGGIKNKTEFDEVLQKSDFESLKNGIQLSLFEELSDFNRIPVTELVDGELVNKKNDKVAQTIKATLQDDENGVVRAVLSDLEGLSNTVWNSNPKQVKTLLKNTEEKAIEISLDLKGLEESYDTKSQAEIMDIIRALDFLLNNASDQSLNNFVERYEEFMGVVKEDLIAVEKVSEKFKNKPLTKVEGKESDYKLFKENGLLRIKNRVFLKTDSNRMILKDIEALMQANNMEISEDDMKEQMFKEPTDDAEYNDEELKKLINYRKYFQTENAQKEIVEIKVPQQIENAEYLKSDFVADMRKEQLLNPNNKALQNLEFSDRGITLTNTDEISIAEMNQYLEENQNLKNYFKLNRNTNFQIEQDDNIVDERTQIVNGKELAQFEDNFRKINSETIQASTNQDFIRIGKDNYERVINDLFAKLPTNETNFYATEVEQPTLNINQSDYTSQKSSPKIEIKNKYSQKESEQIDDDIDCSKNK